MNEKLLLKPTDTDRAWEVEKEVWRRHRRQMRNLMIVQVIWWTILLLRMVF